MSVLIERMEMPECGVHTLLLYVDESGNASIEGFARVYVGEPFEVIPVADHGKLIDADKLIARLEEQRTAILHELPAAHAREGGYTKEDYIFERNGDLISILRNQAAVIPADTEVKRDAETKTTNCDGGGDAD